MEKCPTWAWVVIIILVFITVIQYYNSVSLEEYTECVTNYGDSVKEYATLGIDYTDLLNCYQRDLSICEPPIARGGSPSVFKQYAHSTCLNDWYLVEGTTLCCPNPNMKIVNGNCSY